MKKIICGIYMIRNKINGKVYIGQSDNINRRKNEHFKRYNIGNIKDYNSHLYRSMRKYGVNNFVFKVLEEVDKDLLNDKESYYIIKYNSTDRSKGYNMGVILYNRYHKSSVVDTEKLNKIVDLLINTDITYNEISKITSISISQISYINNGHSFVINKLDYPLRKKKIKTRKKRSKYNYSHECMNCRTIFTTTTSIKKYCSKKCLDLAMRSKTMPERNVLEELLKDNTYSSIAKMYDVTPNCVKKWCKKFSIDLNNKYPDFNLIYKLSFEVNSFAELCRKLNLNKGTFIWYLNKNGYPSNINDIRNYKKEEGIMYDKISRYPSFEEIYIKSFEFESFNKLSNFFGFNSSTLRWYLSKNYYPTNINDIRNYKI